MIDHMRKMKGTGQSPPRVSWNEIFWSWLGSFVGIMAVALLHMRFVDTFGLSLIIGSFGASAVLIYGAIKSPLAQPRNLVGGHLLSAMVGVLTHLLLGPWPWLSAAVAVSVAIALMQYTRTLHPPGGATALIAVIGGESVYSMGYLYLLTTTFGACVMLVVALMVNNIPKDRKYPEYWF